MVTPRLNNLFIRTRFSLESIHFMPNISMNQVTTIIRSPLLMATTANALRGRYTNIIIKVLMPLDFTDATHNSLILTVLINKQAVAKIIQTFFPIGCCRVKVWVGAMCRWSMGPESNGSTR